MTKRWLHVIAGLEIIGGFFGIILVMWQVLIGPVNVKMTILSLVSANIYILSIIAGVTLWQERVLGRTASIIIQAIQLPKILSPSLIFFFSFGLDTYFYWVMSSGFSNLRIDLKLGAYHQFFIGVLDAPYGAGVSLPACIFLIKLLKYKPQPRRWEH